MTPKEKQIYKFIYKTKAGEYKSDIKIEAEEKEAAIATFELIYPHLKWAGTLNLEQ